MGDVRRTRAAVITFWPLVSPIMQRPLTAFLNRPSRDSYLAARQALLSASDRLLAAEDFARLDASLAEKDFDAARDALDALPPIAVLSPRVHLIAAEVAGHAGDSEDCLLERFLATTCLDGILASGDGTKKRPYVVSCTRDEYDVLDALGLTAATQRLAAAGGAALDAILCTSGRRVWFDVAALVPMPAATLVMRPEPVLARPARKKTARSLRLTRTRR